MASSDVPAQASRGERHVRVKSTTCTTWTTFASIKSAAVSPLVRQFYPNPETGRTALTHALDKSKPARGLVVESAELSRYRIRHRGTNEEWNYYSSIADLHTKLFSSTYSRVDSLSRALASYFKGSPPKHLLPFDIEPLHAERQGTAPPRIATECKHSCKSKETCSHLCCKRHLESYETIKSDAEPQTVPNNTTNNECKHLCGDKRTCKHVCCKRHLTSERLEFQTADPPDPTESSQHHENQLPQAPIGGVEECKHICTNKRSCKHLCCKRHLTTTFAGPDASSTMLTTETTNSHIEISSTQVPPPLSEPEPPSDPTPITSPPVGNPLPTVSTAYGTLHSIGSTIGTYIVHAARQVLAGSATPEQESHPIGAHVHNPCSNVREDNIEKGPQHRASAGPVSPQAASPTECKHICTDKHTCRHQCCKRHLGIASSEQQRNTTETQPTGDALPAPLSPPRGSTAAPIPTLPDTSLPTLPSPRLTEASEPSDVQDATAPCKHDCLNRFSCRHHCCKRNLPHPTSRASLLAAAAGIAGCRMNLKLNYNVWEVADTHAEELFLRFRIQDVQSKSEAEENVTLLTACIVVSCALAATREHGDHGITLRQRGPPQCLRRRPIAAEKARRLLETEAYLLRKKARHATSSDRTRLLREAKSAQSAAINFSKEAERVRTRRAQQEANHRFARNAWAAATEVLERPTGESTVHKYPTCADTDVLEHYKRELKASQSKAMLPDRSHLPGNSMAEQHYWSDITPGDVTRAAMKKKSCSAPGEDAIQNTALKKLKSLHPHIAHCFNNLLRWRVCPTQWKSAIVKLLHKGGDDSNPKNWRPIALTSCLGKLFHSIIASSITEHVTKEYILDTSVQKGFLPKLAGCIEHTAAISQCVRHAKQNRKPLCMVQYDLTNAFGSVPHEIILAALKWARIDSVIVEYVEQMYQGSSLRLKLAGGLSEPIPAQRGVLQGDTLSPILFNMVMEVVYRYIRKARPTLGFSTGRDLHFCKAFADDLTFLTDNAHHAQEVTELLETVLACLHMKPNTQKCRVYSLGFNGKRSFTTLRPTIKLCGEAIPHVADKGTTFLGMTIATGKDTPRMVFSLLRDRIRSMMKRIDDSDHIGHAQIWMYQNAVLGRLRYLLTIHDCLTYNLIRRLQKICSKYLRKWINLASYAHPDQLYIRNGGWGLTSLVGLWKECTVSCLTILAASTGSSVHRTLEDRMQWEASLQHSQRNRAANLVVNRLNDRNDALSWVRRHTDEEMIAAYQRRAPIAGRWFNSTDNEELAADYAKALHNLNGKEISRFTSMVLTGYAPPSQTNTRSWGKSDGYVTCPICSERKQTLRHILTSCTTSLEQGRYKYRHDAVLKVLFDTLKTSDNIQSMYFDLPGVQSSGCPPSWLTNYTVLRPDGWLALKDGSEFILELTCPWEENFDLAQERKRAKYEELLRYRQTTNPRTTLLTFEVGARGKLNNSVMDLSWIFGQKQTRQVREMRQRMTETALRTSFMLYVMRHSPTWSPQ